MKRLGLSIEWPTAKAAVLPHAKADLFEAREPELVIPGSKRRRIWELNSNFHCSIIGTCLTTAELRQVLTKMRMQGIQKETDHELHGRAVLIASQRDGASKLLQKALDRKHRSAIGQFGRARNADELRTLWDGAVQRAEIPGAGRSSPIPR